MSFRTSLYSLTGVLGLAAAVLSYQGQGPDELAPVRDMYWQYLGRDLNATEVQIQLSHLRRGATVEDFRAGLLASEEYFGRQQRDPRAWIVGLYRDVLGRTPTRDEVAAWLQKLQAVGGNRLKVAKDFVKAAPRELVTQPRRQGLPPYQPRQERDYGAPPPVPYPREPAPEQFADRRLLRLIDEALAEVDELLDWLTTNDPGRGRGPDLVADARQLHVGLARLRQEAVGGASRWRMRSTLRRVEDAYERVEDGWDSLPRWARDRVQPDRVEDILDRIHRRLEED